ncbi:MAG: hypothetical protein IH602_23835 [Bryobacteraceae bacterium]|nr:hypothetical protein [Bryobacteraceae bacterium]
MEKLHSIRRVFVLLGFTVAVCGQEYCSLHVRVLSPDMRRPQEVEVTVLEHTGRKITKETGLEDVRFCDLGIKPVQVTVGDTGPCNQISVSDVPLGFGSTYLLTVIYDVEACRLPPRSIDFNCKILLRISDESGSPVQDASIRFNKPSHAQRDADRYGRAFLVLGIDDKVTARIAAPGYLSSEKVVSCSPNERDIEAPVILKRK